MKTTKSIKALLMSCVIATAISCKKNDNTAGADGNMDQDSTEVYGSDDNNMTNPAENDPRDGGAATDTTNTTTGTNASGQGTTGGNNTTGQGTTGTNTTGTNNSGSNTGQNNNGTTPTK